MVSSPTAPPPHQFPPVVFSLSVFGWLLFFTPDFFPILAVFLQTYSLGCGCFGTLPNRLIPYLTPPNVVVGKTFNLLGRPPLRPPGKPTPPPLVVLQSFPSPLTVVFSLRFLSRKLPYPPVPSLPTPFRFELWVLSGLTQPRAPPIFLLAPICVFPPANPFAVLLFVSPVDSGILRYTLFLPVPRPLLYWAPAAL